jgi:hypothetical protein
MNTIYTLDPNSTQIERHWYNNWVFTLADDKLAAQCQHLDIPVGYQFMTTNLGQTYIVSNVTFQDAKTGQGQQRSSLSYLNNTLTSCQVDSITVNLRKVDLSASGPGLYWWSWRDSSASASNSCNVDTQEGLFRIAFRATYELTNNIAYDYVVVDNYTSAASVWWGTRILNNYFTGIEWLMARGIYSADYTLASLTFEPGDSDDITSSSFFNVSYYFQHDDGQISNRNIGDPGYNVPSLFNNYTLDVSPPITEAWHFAKVYRSLIMVDLGDNTTTSNLLFTTDNLQYALNPPDDFNRGSNGTLAGRGFDWWRVNAIAPPGHILNGKNTSVPMNQTLSEFNSSHIMGPLGTKDASIYAQYTCTVPQRKSTLALIFTVLVADFAVLSAAYNGFKFIAQRAAQKRDHTAMYCEGCLSQGHALDEVTTYGQQKSGPQTPNPHLFRPLGHQRSPSYKSDRLTSSKTRLLDGRQDDRDNSKDTLIPPFHWEETNTFGELESVEV